MVFSVNKAIALVALLSLTSIGWADTDREGTNDRLDHAGSVLREIMAAPDKGIPEEVLEHAKCIAVVPHMIKGGFVFGAQNGRGVATCRSANGWSAPMFFAITGGSWGLQIGVEGVDLLIKLLGRCVGGPSAARTLRDGLEVRLRRDVPNFGSVVEVH